MKKQTRVELIPTQMIDQTLSPVQSMFKQPNAEGGTTIDYYLYDADGVIGPDCITSPAFYTQLINELRNAKPVDDFHLHLNTYGGSLDTSLMIYEAVKRCNAKVTVHVEGPCCSGGSMILMAAHAVTFNRYSYVMIHTYSGCEVGKASDMNIRHEFNEKWWGSVFTQIYAGFLTEEECEACLKGKDFWFDAKEACDRFTAMKQPEAARNKLLAVLTTEYQDRVNNDIQSLIDDNGQLTDKGIKKLQEIDTDDISQLIGALTAAAASVQKPAKKKSSKKVEPAGEEKKPVKTKKKK